jgi:hypothetical protein
LDYAIAVIERRQTAPLLLEKAERIRTDYPHTLFHLESWIIPSESWGKDDWFHSTQCLVYCQVANVMLESANEWIIAVCDVENPHHQMKRKEALTKKFSEEWSAGRMRMTNASISRHLDKKSD